MAKTLLAQRLTFRKDFLPQPCSLPFPWTGVCVVVTPLLAAVQATPPSLACLYLPAWLQKHAFYLLPAAPFSLLPITLYHRKEREEWGPVLPAIYTIYL